MTTDHLRIRPYAAATDLKPLSAIWLKASLIAHPFIGRERLHQQQRLIEEQYLPNAETWVACLGDPPAGFISLLDDFIGGIFVDPEHQGQGIGRALIAHARALRGGLELEVYTDNQQAMRFYRDLGFRELSRRPLDSEDMPFENARLRLDP